MDNKTNSNQKNKKFKNADESRGVQRFKRVQEEKVEIDNRLKDNSFDAKVNCFPESNVSIEKPKCPNFIFFFCVFSPFILCISSVHSKHF
jgi:hypothetical protein